MVVLSGACCHPLQSRVLTVADMFAVATMCWENMVQGKGWQLRNFRPKLPCQRPGSATHACDVG